MLRVSSPPQCTAHEAHLPRDVDRTLAQGGYYDDVAMTDESCIAYCSNLGYIYAGTEYSNECCEFAIIHEPVERLLHHREQHLFIGNEFLQPLPDGQ